MISLNKLIACIVFLVIYGNIYSQTTTYKVPDLPVEWDYPSDMKIDQDGRTSWTMFFEETGTEFYVNMSRTGLRFTADSLRYMIVDWYKEDPEVSNIQVGVVAPGKMGVHPAEKFQMQFSLKNGKSYVTTAYMVHFHLNRKINAILFYFEIGEKNVSAYEKYQEDIISSLRYRDFTYKKYNYEPDSVQLDYPDFWAVEVKSDTTSWLLIDDGRCKITLSSYTPFDTVSVGTYANMDKDSWKKNPGDFPDLKIKSGTDKVKETGDVIAKNSGSFTRQIQSLPRTINFSKYWFRRSFGKTKKDFVLYMEYPDKTESYYDPIFKKIYESLKLPGAVIPSK